MSFRLFGFPVTIQGSFLVVIAVLGFISFPEQLDRVIAFVAIAVIAVLIHEFGHAFAARSQGTQGSPSISLEGMAGLTRYRLAAPPSRAQSVFISFAGPLAGILLGLVLIGVQLSGVVEDTRWTRDLFNIGYFTTFVWSAFNLMPIVPLDGGHIMTDLLPGSVPVRRRRAAIVSIVVAVVAGALLWWWLRLLFAPVILGMMAFQNYSSLSASRRAPQAPQSFGP
jgi:Zn-dependent protease